MPRKGYSTVALPNILLDQIDEFIKNEKNGYISRPEFIKEAIRNMLLELKKK